jgi:hypothetical protein
MASSSRSETDLDNIFAEWLDQFHQNTGQSVDEDESIYIPLDFLDEWYLPQIVVAAPPMAQAHQPQQHMEKATKAASVKKTKTDKNKLADAKIVKPLKKRAVLKNMDEERIRQELNI